MSENKQAIDRTVGEIIQLYVQGAGYDGLFDAGECACKLDDLAPCRSAEILFCKPGYLQDGEHDDFEFMIGPIKPQPADKETP